MNQTSQIYIPDSRINFLKPYLACAALMTNDKEPALRRLLSIRSRDVTDSGLESAPEYEFGSLASIFKSDSGSGSF